MDRKQAINIAKNQVAELNRRNKIDKIEYIVSEPLEYSNFWYFDHKFWVIKPTEERVMIAGAPGFKVDKKTGKCLTCSWEQLSKMKKDGAI